MSTRPLDLYSFMFTKGLCTSLADLYVNWAYELELAGDFQKAEKVFLKGIETVVGDQQKEELERKQKHFQARVMKQIMQKQQGGGQEANEAAAGEEQRAVLGSLRGHGTKVQKVGSVRIGAAKRSDAPGTFAVPADANAAAGKGGNSVPFKVFKVIHSTPCSD